MTVIYIILFIVVSLIILSRFINVEIYYTSDNIDEEKDKMISIKLKRVLDKNKALKAYFKNNTNLKDIYFDIYPDEKESEKLLIDKEEVSR